MDDLSNGGVTSLALSADHPLLQEMANANDAMLSEQVGNALRAAMGAGALYMLPEVIQELRKSTNIDAKLKFLQMAMKEGGYAAKEKAKDNLPTFSFNFITQNGVQQIQVQSTEPTDDDKTVVDLTYTDAKLATPTHEKPEYAALGYANEDFQEEPRPSDVLQMIDLS